MNTSTTRAPRVVLGVCGGIAAYKSVEILRRLRADGLDVAVVLTPDATRFVGSLTFAALSNEPVRTSLFHDPTTPIPHTALGQGADLVLVAPATAHLIARLAAGVADDLLTATVLATRAPVLLCPAMHTEMWEQPSVQENLATLRRRGVLVLDPATGPLAGGDAGTGRAREPVEIAEAVGAILAEPAGPLLGRRVVVTSGGTREAIDPVRFISNRSSGHQGHAIAEGAARLGAEVTLVTAARRALALDVVRRVDVVAVESADEMATAVLDRAPRADVVVMAAAVADFTVVPATHKLKKVDGAPNLVLTPTFDILAELGARRRDGQVLVGFAAETDDAVANGLAKLRAKRCDLLVVNDVSRADAGFDVATNEVDMVHADGRVQHVSLRTKEAVASEILSNVAALLRGD